MTLNGRPGLAVSGGLSRGQNTTLTSVEFYDVTSGHWLSLPGPEESTLIGPDLEILYSHWLSLLLCHNNTHQVILCLSVCCYGMISGFHAQKGSITGTLHPYSIKTQLKATKIPLWHKGVYDRSFLHMDAITTHRKAQNDSKRRHFTCVVMA